MADYRVSSWVLNVSVDSQLRIHILFVLTFDPQLYPLIEVFSVLIAVMRCTPQ